MPFVAGMLPAVQAQSRRAAGPINFTSNAPAPGAFPAKWICGSPSCMDNQDPPIQVHWYNEHTAFLRQNKAYNYEAPFMHLYFGNERVFDAGSRFYPAPHGLGAARRG